MSADNNITNPELQQKKLASLQDTIQKPNEVKAQEQLSEQQLESQRIQEINQQEQHVITILPEFHLAIKQNNLSKVKEILEKYNIANKLDPRTKQISTFHAVNLETDEESCTMLQLLIDHGYNFRLFNNPSGADPHFKDSLKQTIMFYVAKDGKLKCYELLRKYDCSTSEGDFLNQIPLYYACREGKLEMVQKMLDDGANINHIDSINQTCLFYAARDGQYDTCKFLIDHGININHIVDYKNDAKRQTALHWAKKFNRKVVIDLLVQNGAVTSLKSKQVQPHSQKADSTQGNQSLQKAPASATKRKRNEKEETKIAFKLIYTDQNGVQTELSQQDFNKFKEQYPDLAQLMLDADSRITEEMIDEAKERNTWEKVAQKIIQALWKIKGAYLFHYAVDVVKMQCEDYYNLVKFPMDFSTIKRKLANNVYKNIETFITDVQFNCILYNGEHSEVGQVGVVFQKEFQSLCEIHHVADFLEINQQQQSQQSQQQQQLLEQDDQNQEQQPMGEEDEEDEEEQGEEMQE